MPALLDLLSQRMSDDLVGRLADQIGAERMGTRDAITAALPVLVGGLARNARGGAEGLDRALAEDHDGSLLDNLGALLGRSSGGGALTDAGSGVPGGFSVDRRAADGDGILKHLLGDRRAVVETGISKASGLDVQKVAKLLPLLAPIVMSALGKLRAERGLDAGGLAGLLDRERTELEAQVEGGPGAGLAGLLDRDGDGSLIDDVAKAGSAFAGGALKNKLFGR